MKKHDYDVVIIGAGVGGLICGCYLAKAGLKVLIIEQHNKPGGYCVSFGRNGYKFDVGPHYLGGIERGILGNILEEIEVKNKIQFTRSDPTDRIILPDNVASIRIDPYETVKEFKKNFPKEKIKIEEFFKFIMQDSIVNLYRRAGESNFKEILDAFFEDYKLKATLSIPLLNLGLSPQKASARASLVLYREFFLDPGYYPVGGMGNFISILAKQFKDYGGKLLLSAKVNGIVVQDNSVKSVLTDSDERIDCKYVVSNIDATKTFKQLINQETPESRLVDKLAPALSLFIVYLGLKHRIKREDSANIWIGKSYDIDAKFKVLDVDVKNATFYFYMISSPSEHDLDIKSEIATMQIYTVVPYLSIRFWAEHKEMFADKLIKDMQSFISLGKKEFEIKAIATPVTLEKFTSNRMGSAFGWESSVKQVNPNILSQRTSIRGLFLVGHWCMLGGGQGGVPQVAFSGKKSSELILKEIVR